jgi:K+-transporting ATPase KdpC subunit
MGIKTVMITGDNALTAAAIAAEAGIDDFLAEATPEAKLKLIRDTQAAGRLVAMTGDGTNDAPALAQADVAVAMNSGTQAAKEAGNMIDLDSNPTKLLEVVETGKQMLMTRGALTTFSIANDVAKYFAIIPAAFASTYPALNALNVMHLATPQSAILSAVIFNALIIIALIPLALGGADAMGAQIRPALVSLVLLSLLTGLAYPALVTAIVQVVFPHQANGSLIVTDGRAVGSALIGQPFDDPKYFWGRPSATAPFPYNAAASSGSNLGPTNPALTKAVQDRVDALRAADPGNTAPVPVDLVTASGSGLDPHISPAAALYQVVRVSRARRLEEAAVRRLVEQHIEGRGLGILGEPRVSVLALNLSLDGR